jgi:hypothetical protein
MMNQMKSWMAMGAVVALLAASAAWADVPVKIVVIKADKSGVPSTKNTHGGDVPFPFKKVNETVELADGSPYALTGKIVFKPGVVSGKPGPAPFLEVDLDKHEWLRNERRALSPLYPLKGSRSFWERYEGARVRLSGYARGYVIRKSSQETGYEVFLDAVSLEVFSD